jgi:multidrug efflux pump subunit AcrB
MWIVDIAIRRPHTFIVMALFILIATPLALLKMPTDIFPGVDIPVISIAWNYAGLSAQEVANRITRVNERALSTLVSGVEHTESQSFAGVSLIKIFFHPTVNVQEALAQVVAVEQSLIQQMPPGIKPPFIIKYSASSVPIIRLGLSSPSMSEQDVVDTALTTLRPQLTGVPGAAIPYPDGGKISEINVDLDTHALQAKGLTPSDVVDAVNAQNLVLPGGTIKMGELEHTVALNSSFDTIEAINQLPVRSRGGATVRLEEVGHVRDGFAPQINVARQNGRRGALISVIKNGAFSTLDIVAAVRAILPEAAQSMPKDFIITPLFDQSVFVRSAVDAMVREAVIAACLTAVLVLVFLGNWRSTVIIWVSIPLSIMSSILLLFALGETLNIMTLGGLALAVGILVDDATVTLENIERYLHQQVPLREAVRIGAGEIAVPTFVSTLCICVVFAPMFFLSGVVHFLFAPLAEAVVFAMVASYVLSRTLVPTLVILLMDRGRAQTGARSGLLHTIHRAFNAAFDHLRGGYVLLLSHLLVRRKRFIALFFAFCALSLGLLGLLGRDFFPIVDSGQIRLHIRMPSGSRIEETERTADHVENLIRSVIPAGEIETILDNIGVSNSGINLCFSNAGTIGPIDGEILIALKARHADSSSYVARLRRDLPRHFPGVEFFFQPADMVSQILNFGVPATVDVQFSGADVQTSLLFASRLMKEVKTIPGAVDVHVHQRLDQPTLRLTMDRTQMQQLDIDPSSVAQNVLVSLSGNSQTAPAYWYNPNTGGVYDIVVQTPQYRMDSVSGLMSLPVRGSGSSAPAQLLANLVMPSPARTQAVVSLYNARPVIDVFLGVANRDLGGVASEVQRRIALLSPQLPRGARITMRGQVQTMNATFASLLGSLGLAIVLIYLLIVVNFQSWVDAFIIIIALPAALAGIAWILALTGTTLSVPVFMGAIMTMGVATANSILVVSFARQRLEAGDSALKAALQAAGTRARPVMMTALAMIVGMIPMALGLGEAGEQNAPLGRAAIGGLLFATVSTLLLVPVLFAAFHRRGCPEKARLSQGDGHNA